MSKAINTEEESALSAAVDSVLGSIPSKKSGILKQKAATKGSKLRKTKLKSLDGSLKPSKPSPLAEGSNFKNTLIERSTADERLRSFMLGEFELDGVAYDSDVGKQYTLEEIGRVMGVSRERVRQIEEQSLRKLWRLLDIMSKRENLNQQDWLGIFENGMGHGEDTVYFPG